jgi:hypothetical protein
MKRNKVNPAFLRKKARIQACLHTAFKKMQDSFYCEEKLKNTAAHAALYLMSNGYTTESTLYVDGGRILR